MKPVLADEYLKDVIFDRMLVFLEGDGGFRQVVLSREQYLKLTALCGYRWTGGEEAGDRAVDYMLRLDKVIPAHTFDGLESFSDEQW